MHKEALVLYISFSDFGIKGLFTIYIMSASNPGAFSR